MRSYVDSEIGSLRSRVKQLAQNVDSVDKTVRAKDAHLVSNAYHMSSVESNTQNSLNEVKQRLGNVEVQFSQLTRDLASLNSMVTVLRQDQQRLLSQQAEENRKISSRLSEAIANMQNTSQIKNAEGARGYDEAMHRVQQLETTLNSKFEQLTLKLTNQLVNVERNMSDERRITQESMESRIQRSETKLESKRGEETVRSGLQMQKLLETATNQEDSIDWIINKLKTHEKKTGDRLRSLNTDYQQDMKHLTDSINTVTGLVDSKVKLMRDEFSQEVTNLKKLLTLT